MVIQINDEDGIVTCKIGKACDSKHRPVNLANFYNCTKKERFQAKVLLAEALSKLQIKQIQL